MPLNLTRLVPIYERAIDDIVNQMGKECRLLFPASIINVDEDLTDPARGGNKKPSYKGDEPLPIETRDTKIIRFLLEHNPLDYETFGIKIKSPQDILKVKGYITDVPELKRAEYLVPDINVESIISNRYRMLRDPVPQGLKNNRYFIAYFERVL